jgi:uncharacterized iron-regulated membrane protein
MNRKTWYQLHKYAAIAVGLFFLAWTISGIVMILPERWFEPGEMTATSSPDYTAAQISPAEAIATLETDLGRSLSPGWVGLTHIDGRMLYEVVDQDGSTYLVDADSARQFEITAEVAGKLVQERTGSASSPQSIELLTNHDLVYPAGPLPVYRVKLNSQDNHFYYVNFNNGGISRSTQATRLRNAITSLHTFEPVRLLTERGAARKGLLLTASLIGIGASISGYILAVLPYLQRKPHKKVVRPVDVNKLDRETG